MSESALHEYMNALCNDAGVESSMSRPPVMASDVVGGGVPPMSSGMYTALGDALGDALDITIGDGYTASSTQEDMMVPWGKQA